jgi:hypothetical protein
MAIRKRLTLLFVLCLAGCVPSLHQLYTANTLVYDPAIAGNWQHDDERWQFVGDPNDKSYELTIVDKEGKPSQLVAHLVKIDDHRFFDFYPAEDAQLEAGDWLKFHLLPVHLFFSVEKKQDALFLAAMNPDEIRKMLQEKPNWIKHEVVEDDRVVLTDSPENLQKFLLEGLKTDDFFGEPFELTPVSE